MSAPEHTVYRCFGEDGELLYVGVSSTPDARLAQHQRTAPWWTDVVRVSRASFPTRSDAERAEADAIWNESPCYNVVGKGPDRAVIAKILEKAPPLTPATKAKIVALLQREVLSHAYREIAGLELERDRLAERLSWTCDEIDAWRERVEEVSAPGWQPTPVPPPPGQMPLFGGAL